MSTPTSRSVPPSVPAHWLIIPAAGSGSRMRMQCPKQYLRVAGKTILEHTLSRFEAEPVFRKILVGISPADSRAAALDLSGRFTRVHCYEGGTERAETVLRGLQALQGLADADDWIWVHDAARPCLSTQEIKRLLNGLEDEICGLVLAVPVADTLKRALPQNSAGRDALIQTTVERDYLWRAMTPQIFRYAELKHALSECLAQGVKVTDESSAIEYLGRTPGIIQGSEHNIKVTLADDLLSVEACLKQQAGTDNSASAARPVSDAASTMRANIMQYPRIGTGFDVHAFGEGDSIILGGVTIPYTRGLLAHSDGDVLLHALMDAMLGALALGDIGKHFPDTDPAWKGADSRSLLRHVNKLIHSEGFQVGNIDSTIIAQAPRMAPSIAKMQANIAQDLELELNAVSIKATTTERLGFTGRQEGIACQASVMLIPVAVEANGLALDTAGLRVC
jgi:2-C-methyl-D-erythritol 2,4-cyclodiphosphate synthase/2-C-methyl-D-erythritol 4-phosphate cytidylyltransferase